MSFIQPCFIKKNTPELRKKLEELGYIPPYKIWSDENFAICTIYRDNIGEYIVFKIDDDFENVIKPSYPYIDCGTNEELFLALAALRDDTPINSYYWFNDKLVMCYSMFDLNINQSITYRFQSVDNPKICFPSNIYNMRKASIEEIIEHFKDK